MKASSRFVIAVVVAGWLVTPLLHAESAVKPATATLILKPMAQVTDDQVRLRDLITLGAADAFGEAVICRAPDAGTVRILERSEVAAALKKQNLDYRLQGASTISITRIGRKIVTSDLRTLIEAAFAAAKATVNITDIEMQASVVMEGEPALLLRKLKFDPAIQKYRAWFVANEGLRKINFEATATVESGSAPLELTPGTSGPRSAKAQLLVRRGENVTMQLNGAGFSANVPVVSMEDGVAGKLVRARDNATKRNYRAEVIAAGLLRAVRQEN